MSTYLHELILGSLGPSQAWKSVREHHHQIEKAASRLKAIDIKTQEQPEESSSEPHPLSALERLPEEILITIMEYLDYESLYRLSQTTGYFLRLSFDIVFEFDASWRTFRHTVDRLSNGPKRRVLDGAQSSRHTPAFILEPQSDDKSEPTIQPSEAGGATFDTNDEDEGEIMLEFMARSS